MSHHISNKRPTTEELEALIKRMREHPDYRYILECRTHQLTVEQAEAKHLVSDSRLAKKPIPFGFQNQQWQTLLSKLQDGDEMWEYDHNVGPLSAEAGIAIIRGGEVVDHIVTLLS